MLQPVDIQIAPPKATAESDPYAEFLSTQRKREREWKVNREAKRTKLHAAYSDNEQDSSSELREQLAKKTEECSKLQAKLDSMEEALQNQMQKTGKCFQGEVSLESINYFGVFNCYIENSYLISEVPLKIT